MRDLEEADRRVIREVCLLRGCQRPAEGRCPAINHPSEMWAEGECWALTRDPNWRAKLVASLAAYAGITPADARYNFSRGGGWLKTLTPAERRRIRDYGPDTRATHTD